MAQANPQDTLADLHAHGHSDCLAGVEGYLSTDSSMSSEKRPSSTTPVPKPQLGRPEVRCREGLAEGKKGFRHIWSTFSMLQREDGEAPAKQKEAGPMAEKNPSNVQTWALYLLQCTTPTAG